MIDARVDSSVIVDAANAPALQQQITNYVALGAQLSAALPATPVAGDLLVMIGATPSGALTAVTGAAAAWTLATSSTTNANIEVWYAIADGSSPTVTIARTNNASDMFMSVSEWSGITKPIVLDGATSTSGIASPASAGSITTTGPTLVMFGVADGSPNTFGAPTPGTWTLMTGIAGADVQNEWYRVATMAGTFAPTVTDTAHTWDAAIVAFRYTP